MKILYAAAGTTDPVRNGREGAILQIVRHYKPDYVYIFLTAEMAEYEKYNNVYSRSVNYIMPECKVECIISDIEDPHHIDSLIPIIEEFSKIHNEYPEAEFLINLSSGTPQMKTIMDTIALDFDAKGIQVDSPEKGSNRMNHPDSKDSLKKFDELMENDEECYADFGHPSRCSEPELGMLKRYAVKHQLESLVKEFEYAAALKVYNRYRKFFSKKTGELLEHATARVSLNFSKAFEYESMNLYRGMKYASEIRNLHEYRMLIEMHCQKKELTEFIVKLTPFLYELVLFHLTKHVGIDINSICDKKGKNHYSVSVNKLKENHQHFLDALDYEFGCFKDCTALSFYNMLVMLSVVESEREIFLVLKDLRTIEETYRNEMAHTIVTDVTDEALKKIAPFKTSEDINKLLTQAYKLIMRTEKLPNLFEYNNINKQIIESMNAFN